MKRNLSILLIIAGLGLAIFGFTKLEDSKADIKIGDLEINAEDQSQSNEAFYLIGAGAIALMAGLFMVSRR